MDEEIEKLLKAAYLMGVMVATGAIRQALSDNLTGTKWKREIVLHTIEQVEEAAVVAPFDPADVLSTHRKFHAEGQQSGSGISDGNEDPGNALLVPGVPGGEVSQLLHHPQREARAVPEEGHLAGPTGERG